MAEVSKYPGISNIYTATNDSLENPYGDSIARISKDLVEKNNY